MVKHGLAMKIRAHRSEIGELPPPGVGWRWTDVVGTSEGKVDPVAAHAARPLITQNDDGTYETTRRLARYMQEKHWIELTGSVTEPQQATLPGVESSPRTGRESVRADGGTGTDTHGPEGRDDEVRQLSLTGEDVTEDVHDVQAAETLRRHDESGDQCWCARHERSARDAAQTRLTVFTATAAAGALRRSAGDAYPPPSSPAVA